MTVLGLAKESCKKNSVENSCIKSNDTHLSGLVDFNQLVSIKIKSENSLEI